MLTRTEEPQRPSGQSVFRRINAAWLSKVVKEIQSLVFNRCWPRLLQKLMSSSVMLTTELFTENTIVGLLPSYQEVHPFRVSRSRGEPHVSAAACERKGLSRVPSIPHPATLGRYHSSRVQEAQD